MVLNEINPAALAYLGDAVLELMARETVLASGISDVGKLNAMARSYVQATAQSAAIERILDSLSEEELNLFKRGRNYNGISIPKSASAKEYRQATGLETLFAYLYLKGQTDRMKELFEMAFGKYINLQETK